MSSNNHKIKVGDRVRLRSSAPHNLTQRYPGVYTVTAYSVWSVGVGHPIEGTLFFLPTSLEKVEPRFRYFERTANTAAGFLQFLVHDTETNRSRWVPGPRNAGRNINVNDYLWVEDERWSPASALANEIDRVKEIDALPAGTFFWAPHALPKVRWFVNTTPAVNPNDVLFIEFVGDAGTYTYKSGETWKSSLDVEPFERDYTYKEVFERPKPPFVSKVRHFLWQAGKDYFRIEAHSQEDGEYHVLWFKPGAGDTHDGDPRTWAEVDLHSDKLKEVPEKPVEKPVEKPAQFCDLKVGDKVRVLNCTFAHSDWHGIKKGDIVTITQLDPKRQTVNFNGHTSEGVPGTTGNWYAYHFEFVSRPVPQKRREVFYTVTDRNTEHTNSRSRRYATEEEALNEAKSRLERGSANSKDGVYVLKAVKLVQSQPNITVLAL